MGFWRSIAFRAWITFGIIGLAISIPLSIFFKNQHEEIVYNHTQEEFNNNAQIAATIIKQAITLENFQLLQLFIENISENGDFVFIAIVEDNSVFSCYPEDYTDKVLQKNDDFIYSSSEVNTSLVKGEIIISASKSKSEATLSKLNEPIIYLISISIIASIVLFAFSLFFLTRPIFKAIKVAQELSDRNYDVKIQQSKRDDEIGQLNNSLYTLKENLVILKEENEAFTDSLEDRINVVTAEIKQKNVLTNTLLEISKVFLTASNIDGMSQIKDSLEIICVSLELDKYAFVRVDSTQKVSHLSNAVELNEPIEVDALKRLKVASEKHGIISNETDLDPETGSFIERFIVPQSKFYFYTFVSELGDENFMFLCDTKSRNLYPENLLLTFLDVYASLLNSFLRYIGSEMELKNLNRVLEDKVLEKTKINLEISNSLIGQEKLVMLGELSAGIAHDLNTPLGSIKASSESVGALLNSIMKNSLDIKPAQVQLITKVLQIDPLPDIFLRTREARKATTQISQYLMEIYGDTAPNLSKMIANLGLNIAHKEIIKDIFRQEEPDKIITLLREYITAHTLINVIESSTDNASTVVSNLNRFVKQDLDQIKEPLNLKASVNVLEPLFRYRIKNQFNFSVSISDDHFVYGIEMDLFQVWSNLMKNALDAFEQEDYVPNGAKEITITSERENDDILIHFINNGPKIPDKIRQKILKKFFTTKKDKGTGLGLSIVSKIVAEHYGTIDINSSDELTTFTIKLPTKKRIS